MRRKSWAQRDIDAYCRRFPVFQFPITPVRLTCLDDSAYNLQDWSIETKEQHCSGKFQASGTGRFHVTLGLVICYTCAGLFEI